MGVDLFFVLSGYFITTILLAARSTHFAPLLSDSWKRPAVLKTDLVGVAYEKLVKGWGATLWFWFYAGNIRSAILNAWPPKFSLVRL
jgi:hypothetical protein